MFIIKEDFKRFLKIPKLGNLQNKFILWCISVFEYFSLNSSNFDYVTAWIWSICASTFSFVRLSDSFVFPLLCFRFALITVFVSQMLSVLTLILASNFFKFYTFFSRIIYRARRTQNLVNCRYLIRSDFPFF